MSDSATVTPPRARPTLTARQAPEPRGPAERLRRRRVLGQVHLLVLGLILLVTLLLRLWGIKQGLPYSYNSDEATHFVPRAVAFFSHDLNPHYFLNPPAYSYLLHVVFELWFGNADAVVRAYTDDPTAVFVVARVVAALLGTTAVGLTYLAGSRILGRAVGLMASAILAVAFLPVFYSHLALNDVPTLAPLALALVGIAGVLDDHRTRGYVVAGIGIGLAAATKYTGGITLVCLVGAALASGPATGWGATVRRLSLALLIALACFALANPYAVLDFPDFIAGISQQASLAAGQDPVKLGSSGSGIVYYLWSFTWGLGWVPAVAAVGGAVLLLVRRRIGLTLMLVPAPIAFIIFMGSEQRFFGRWLMPVFPIVAILAAYGACELVRAIWRRSRVAAAALAPVAVVALLAQSVVAVVHDDAVLSRPDTRNLTRAWMAAHVPAGAKVVIEPVVPDNWASDVGRSLPWTPTGDRWLRYATWLTDVDPQGRPLPAGQRRYVLVDEYERTLRPALVDQYVASGFCWVVVGSLQEGRALADPAIVPGAIAYYRALARRGRVLYRVTPFSRGSRPVAFSFDWSIDYYPPAYRLPGPQMRVLRLSGGRCGPPLS